jgi:hypothetical protein
MRIIYASLFLILTPTLFILSVMQYQSWESDYQYKKIWKETHNEKIIISLFNGFNISHGKSG